MEGVAGRKGDERSFFENVDTCAPSGVAEEKKVTKLTGGCLHVVLGSCGKFWCW